LASAVVLLQQRERRLVVKVGALPLDLLMCAGQQAHCLVTAPAALLPSGYAPLGFGELLFRLAVVAGICDRFPVSGDEEHLQPNVTAGVVSGPVRRSVAESNASLAGKRELSCAKRQIPIRDQYGGPPVRRT
jgi:hypothetical protein